MPFHIDPHTIERITEGDEHAFGVLYQKMYPFLQPIAHSCRSVGISEDDVFQLAFVKVWLNREKLFSILEIKSWIIKIAYREYLMAVRQKLMYEEKVSAASRREVGIDPSDGNLRLQLKEIKAITSNVVSGLSPNRKVIYHMSREQGLKIHEIAEQLGISPNTVKSTLQTVLKTIREELIIQGYGPFAIIIFLQFQQFQ